MLRRDPCNELALWAEDLLLIWIVKPCHSWQALKHTANAAKSSIAPSDRLKLSAVKPYFTSRVDELLVKRMDGIHLLSTLFNPLFEAFAYVPAAERRPEQIHMPTSTCNWMGSLWGQS